MKSSIFYILHLKIYKLHKLSFVWNRWFNILLVPQPWWFSDKPFLLIIKFLTPVFIISSVYSRHSSIFVVVGFFNASPGVERGTFTLNGVIQGSLLKRSFWTLFYFVGFLSKMRHSGFLAWRKFLDPFFILLGYCLKCVIQGSLLKRSFWTLFLFCCFFV